MRPATILLFLVPLLLAGRPPAERYEVDPEHTFLTFRVSRFGMVDVVGFFPEVSGTIVYDPADPHRTRADITVQTPSVYTGRSEARDKAVRSPFFLDVAAHPTMTFRTTAIEEDGDALVAVGDLTIRGVTREVRIPFHLTPPARDPTGLTTLGIAGSLTVDRLDFGIFEMDKKRADGTPFIGREVAISLNVLAVLAEE